MSLHVLSLLVSNHFGVLTRVTTIFSRRTLNIKSLTVAETEDPSISRVSILMEGDENDVRMVKRLLAKQEDVIKAAYAPISQITNRELMMIKVKNTPKLQEKLNELRGLYHIIMLDSNPHNVLMEVSGSAEQIMFFINTMSEYGIVELCRTGVGAIGTGEKTLADS